MNQKQVAVNCIRQFVILFLLLSVFIMVACTPQPVDCAREDVYCVGLLTAYDGVDDHGLNQAAWETLQNIETQAQIARLDNIESVDPRDWQKNILFFAEGGYDVIVTVGRELSDDTVFVAVQYPQILFVGVDQQLEEEYLNVATIDFPEEQAGFLAGMLAAMVTETDTVGAVCETSEIETVWRYCEGFRLGATYEKDDVQVIVTYRDNGSFDSTFNNPDWGEQKALSQVDKGVDVMTGYGGRTMEGALLAAAEKGVLIIGTEDDLYYRLPDVQPVLITSVVNDPGAELSQIVNLAQQGEISAGVHTGQIELTPFRTSQFEAAGELQLAMNAAIDAIINGEIEINMPPQK